MSLPDSNHARATVDGKFFRLGPQKFYLKGVTYGPFAPEAAGATFPASDQAARDLDLMRQLGANLIRIYDVPPRPFLDQVAAAGLKVLVDVPWNKHLCVLDSEPRRQAARTAVRQAAFACARHPAVFALSVVNEIPADIVRWSGADAVARFIDELVELVKGFDPECLCTFGNYPPTEFLHPREIDFHCFNVYLHHRRPFENYLARLQMLADAKPLVLGEFGIDSIREGTAAQREILGWQVETAFRHGLAGAVVYSFTDEWFKDGQPMHEWAFGLTTAKRRRKESFQAVQEEFAAAPHFPLPRDPEVSVVVAVYNGARTLKACLDSLGTLDYPAFEILLVDDGSTDDTARIAAQYPRVRYLRHPDNLGLSTARNTGIAAARGEIIAFTDADCRADENWLYYLVGDLLDSRFVGIGGHNLLPPDDSWVAAAVMVSPGGPAHVMATDRLAEHIPGCNMAFYKWALDEIGGFDPVFRQAGDDVDVCWRLQQRGYRIGFCPAAFVWHYRRSTAIDYLKQQHGYGEAEALLVRKHPEYFNLFGGRTWEGRIYSPAKYGVVFRRPRIYHGLFGSGFFQSLYTARPVGILAFFTSLEYYVLVALPLLVLSVSFRFLAPLAVTSLLVSLTVCVVAAAQADLPRRKNRLGSRPLIAVLFFLQPIVRGWARYQGRLLLHQIPPAVHETLESLSLQGKPAAFREVRYWAEPGTDRLRFIARVLEQLDRQGWENKADVGWTDYDVEIYGSRWSRLQLTSAAESFPGGRQLVRCRLHGGWTLLARIVFWSTFGFELLVFGLLGPRAHWLWLLLLSLPAFVWWLNRKKRDLQRLVTVFLDEVAKQLNLVKMPADATEPAPEPPLREPQS
ncbi:MAG: glycosyltransferase [Verrucomicrobia bacterium]|nr:glycosyltransferase [Verrucomicrobiota bacterium]